MLFAAAVAAVVPACSSYEDEARALRANWADGNFQTAAEIAKNALEDSGENEILIWQIERGTTLRALGNIPESSEVFERAAGTFDRWNDAPEILLSKEMLASLTNLSALPYRGRGGDAIMLHTYRALNFLENGNADSARVALNAAYRAQSEAVERNAKNIAAAREEARKNSVNVRSLLEKTGMSKELAAQDKTLDGVRVLSDYVNPFTTWLHGIYFLHAGTDASDFERARISLSRAVEMYPKNPYISEDAKLAERGVHAATPLTYVVFESGLAPVIGVVRVDTMLPIPTGRGYFSLMPVSIVLPKLVLSDHRKYWGIFPLVSGSYSRGDASPERVSALGADGVPASEICDMNSVVRTDFDNAYPAVLTRTLVSAFLKSTAAAAVNAVGIEYAHRDGGVGAAVVSLATIIGSSVYAYASSGADVRCWQTLPQNFSVVRTETPASRRIRVSVGARSREVELLAGTVNLVIVKTVAENDPLVISQSVLKK